MKKKTIEYMSATAITEYCGGHIEIPVIVEVITVKTYVPMRTAKGTMVDVCTGVEVHRSIGWVDVTESCELQSLYTDILVSAIKEDRVKLLLEV